MGYHELIDLDELLAIGEAHRLSLNLGAGVVAEYPHDILRNHFEIVVFHQIRLELELVLLLHQYVGIERFRLEGDARCRQTLHRVFLVVTAIVHPFLQELR